MYGKDALALVVIFYAGVVVARGPIPDILLDKEDTGNDVQGNNIGRILSGPMDNIPEAPCEIDVRLTKKIIGKCVKLGPGTEGCVAGSYVHPFHQDCAFLR